MNSTKLILYPEDYRKLRDWEAVCRILDVSPTVEQITLTVSGIESDDASATIRNKIKNNIINTCCNDCAVKHRNQTPYDGTYTQRTSTCQICNKEKSVTSARKLFGYYSFV